MRREYIDYQRTPVVFASTHFIQRYDPLPLLLASTIWALDDPNEEIEGRWLGDVVHPTNESLDAAFSLVANDYVDWTIDWPVLRGVTDEGVREMIVDTGVDLEAGGNEDYLPILLGKQ